MNALALVCALLLIAGILWDAFETVVLPRRVSRRLRLALFAFVPAWRIYSALMRRVPPGGRRETYLSYFGPLSIIWLLALWAIGLVFGFGLLQWGLGSHVSSPDGVTTLATTGAIARPRQLAPPRYQLGFEHYQISISSP